MRDEFIFLGGCARITASLRRNLKLSLLPAWILTSEVRAEGILIQFDERAFQEQVSRAAAIIDLPRQTARALWVLVSPRSDVLSRSLRAT
jgi:hypothetical protein